MWLRIGLPFCRVDTRIAEGPDRFGRACGLGCCTLGWTVDGVPGLDGRELASLSPRDCDTESALD